jgi:aerobic carbon-monoxide dehydrogenase large subunit
MPYRTAMGRAYDSGHFAANLDRALELAGYGSIAERKRQARAEGKLRGLGICAYAKLCGGATQEAARVEVSAEGKVLLLIGTQSNGQGHATAYGQVLADELGVDLEKIELLQGDTDVVGWGAGTGGSWSLLSGGSAARRATEDAIEKGRAVAAAALEAAAADIAFTEGRYVIKGTDRIPLSESRVLGKIAVGALAAGDRREGCRRQKRTPDPAPRQSTSRFDCHPEMRSSSLPDTEHVRARRC